MRVGHLNVSRQPWYDRSSAPNGFRYDAATAGVTAATVVQTYTVPSRRGAYVDSIQIAALRRTATSPGAFFRLYVDAVFGVSARPLLAQIWSDVSAYGAVGDEWVGQAGILNAGNQLRLVVEQTSSGIVDYNGSAKWTEYDAFAP